MESEYHVKKFYTGSRIIENVCVNTIDNKIDDWNKPFKEIKLDLKNKFS